MKWHEVRQLRAYARIERLLRRSGRHYPVHCAALSTKRVNQGAVEGVGVPVGPLFDCRLPPGSGVSPSLLGSKWGCGVVAKPHLNLNVGIRTTSCWPKPVILFC